MAKLVHQQRGKSRVQALTVGRRGGVPPPKFSLILVVLDDVGTEYLDYHELGAQYSTGEILRSSPAPGILWSYFTTPRLTSLAHRGIHFRNFFGTSLCSTTRVRIHAGKRLDQLGVGNNIRHPATALNPLTYPAAGFALDDSIVFLAERLRAADPTISTAHFGKWHLADPWSTVNDGGSTHAPDVNLTDPERMGYQTANWSPLPYGGHYSWWHIVSGTPTYIDGEGTHTFTEATHAGSVMPNAACSWIAGRTGQFFASVSLEYTHMPLDCPPFTLLSGATQTYLTGLGIAAGNRLIGSPDNEDPRVDPKFWPQLYANAEAMDTMIGRIEDSIPAALKPTTFIIVVGDNGGNAAVTPPNFPGNAKDSLTRGGTGVTCVVYGPRVARPGRFSPQLCDIGDIYPTICELMGHPGGDGVSLVPAITDDVNRDDLRALKPHTIEQAFYPCGTTTPSLMNSRHRTIVDGRWRYTDNDGTFLFYDLRADPLEATNLLASSESTLSGTQGAALESLRATLDDELPTS
jgi:arylsulfatase A-like enzyme